MPAYITNPATQQINALYPGGSIYLVNSAATDSGVTKTLQFAVGPQAGTNPRITVVNTTNQDCPMQAAWQDADADYEPISGGICTKGSSLVLNLQGGFVRGDFASAPTSGSLVVMA